MVCPYKAEDLSDTNHCKYCAMILFNPQSGVIYCFRERRRAGVGVEKSLSTINMSWLWLTTSGFAVDSFVKRFFYEDEIQKSSDFCHVKELGKCRQDAISAFRVITQHCNRRRDKMKMTYVRHEPWAK